jgi:hypothetical protein
MDHLGFRGANARGIVPFHTHISVLIEVLPQPAGVRQDETPREKSSRGVCLIHASIEAISSRRED